MAPIPSPRSTRGRPSLRPVATGRAARRSSSRTSASRSRARRRRTSSPANRRCSASPCRPRPMTASTSGVATTRSTASPATIRYTAATATTILPEATATIGSMAARVATSCRVARASTRLSSTPSSARARLPIRTSVFSFAKIKDFAIGEDQILLDSLIFKALDPGALSSDAFAIGKKAKSDEVHILYKNGEVRYDKDGEGGKAAVLFAKVNPGLAIDADDFLVI